MRVRRQTVEHTFGTLKAWMGYTHFLTRTLPRVATEMSLQVLAYNMKRLTKIIGVQPLSLVKQRIDQIRYILVPKLLAGGSNL